MPPDLDPRITHARDEIRRHLKENPHAADTLEGIHQWWIRWPGPMDNEAITESALRELEGLGEVRCMGRLWRRG